MALTDCPECGSRTSTEATFCPECGFPIKKAYADLWLREPHSAGGLTCCQAADLSNATAELDQRLDVVFVRWGNAGFGGRGRVDLLGEEMGDIFTHPVYGYTLWPSDHAGVAAWLWPAPGHAVTD